MSRKKKSKKDLRRSRTRRPSFQKVLIVCEGKKTETSYFKEIKKSKGDSSVKVEVEGKSSSSPRSVVDYARKRFKSEKERGDPYDKVFCVFDKDSHSTYEEAFREIEGINLKEKRQIFFVVESVPCFEFWLLLHFKDSARPYDHNGQVKSELEKEWRRVFGGKEYKKNAEDHFQQTEAYLDIATQRAQQILENISIRSSDNPSTKVHWLVHFLSKLREANEGSYPPVHLQTG